MKTKQIVEREKSWERQAHVLSCQIRRNNEDNPPTSTALCSLLAVFNKLSIIAQILLKREVKLDNPVKGFLLTTLFWHQTYNIDLDYCLPGADLTRKITRKKNYEDHRDFLKSFIPCATLDNKIKAIFWLGQEPKPQSGPMYLIRFPKRL